MIWIIGTSDQCSSRSAFGWSTGIDASGHYKHHYFLIFSASVVYLEGALRSKNLFCESWRERWSSAPGGNRLVFYVIFTLPNLSNRKNTQIDSGTEHHHFQVCFITGGTPKKVSKKYFPIINHCQVGKNKNASALFLSLYSKKCGSRWILPPSSSLTCVIRLTKISTNLAQIGLEPITKGAQATSRHSESP